MVIEEDRFQQEVRIRDEVFHKALYQERLNRACTGVWEEPFQESPGHQRRIYCANCIHCKLLTGTVLFTLSVDGEDRDTPRIRCAAGKWKKKLGQEKLYKYSTIIRRHLEYCDAYEAMGDARDFIRELRKTMSPKDAPYKG
ncbi:MAG: hypothetical protein LBC51_02345 [Treponema sp.]|jgi:hypothetical protein|nr:hypothetical protein [Treponema sp.]